MVCGLYHLQCGLIVALCNRQNVMLVSECERHAIQNDFDVSQSLPAFNVRLNFEGKKKAEIQYLNLRRTKDQAVSNGLLFIVRMDGWMHHCVFRMNCLFTYCV